MRDGLLKALAAMPGHECHAIHTRLAEMLPFIPGAIKACEGSPVSEAMEGLERLLRGE